MQRKPDKEGARDVGDLICGMGRERMALRAEKTTVLLALISSFACLATALAGFTGYVLPRAAGPATVLLVAAVAGFVASVTPARRVRW